MTYSFLLHQGFYNFLLSLAAFFLLVGYWIRNRQRLIGWRALVLCAQGKNFCSGANFAADGRASEGVPIRQQQAGSTNLYKEAVRLFRSLIDTPVTGFRVVWGVSANATGWLEIDGEIGYAPADDSASVAHLAAPSDAAASFRVTV